MARVNDREERVRLLVLRILKLSNQQEIYDLLMVPVRDAFEIKLFKTTAVKERIGYDLIRLNSKDCDLKYMERYLEAFMTSHHRFPASWAHYVPLASSLETIDSICQELELLGYKLK